MRFAGLLVAFIFTTANPGSAQTHYGFSGKWKLNPARSEIHNLPVPPALFLNIEESHTAITVSAAPKDSGPFTVATYPLNGVEGVAKADGSTMKTLTQVGRPCPAGQHHRERAAELHDHGAMETLA